MIRRVGRPGLLGLAARTAVVAGTATAVSGAMRNRGETKQEQAAQAQAYQAQQQQDQMNQAAQQAVAAQQASAPAAAAAAPVDTVAEIQKLASLHQAGALTDEEFSQAKAKLLA